MKNWMKIQMVITIIQVVTNTEAEIKSPEFETVKKCSMLYVATFYDISTRIKVQTYLACALESHMTSFYRLVSKHRQQRFEHDQSCDFAPSLNVNAQSDAVKMHEEKIEFCDFEPKSSPDDQSESKYELEEEEDYEYEEDDEYEYEKRKERRMRKCIPTSKDKDRERGEENRGFRNLKKNYWWKG